MRISDWSSDVCSADLALTWWRSAASASAGFRWPGCLSGRGATCRRANASEARGARRHLSSTMQVRGIPLQLHRVYPVVDAAFPQLARERPELPHLRQRRLHQRERDPEAVRRLQRQGVGGGGDLRLANQDMQFAGTRSKRILVAMKRLDVRSR